MPQIDSTLSARRDSNGSSPYRIRAPSPASPPPSGICVPPELTVFVLLVLVGLTWFLRERPSSESDGGRLGVVESPAPIPYGHYGPGMRSGLSHGIGGGGRQLR
jgi:hypothetical protein